MMTFIVELSLSLTACRLMLCSDLLAARVVALAARVMHGLPLVVARPVPVIRVLFVERDRLRAYQTRQGPYVVPVHRVSPPFTCSLGLDPIFIGQPIGDAMQQDAPPVSAQMIIDHAACDAIERAGDPRDEHLNFIATEVRRALMRPGVQDGHDEHSC